MATDIIISQKERLPFVDITKGVLVIFLVFHHIVNMAKEIISVENIEYITQWDILYVPYFMQAFFFITGYCSSFNRPIGTFVYSNVKSILVPLLFFSLVNQFVCWVINDEEFFFVTVLGKRIFFLAELYWFLSALFITKILLWIIIKISQKKTHQFFLVFVPFLIAVSLNTSHFHSYNWLHWHNALVNLLFLWIGFTFKRLSILKNNIKLYGIVACILYIIGITAFSIFGKAITLLYTFPSF